LEKTHGNQLGWLLFHWPGRKNQLYHVTGLRLQGAEAVCDLIEDSIDESSRVFRAESLPDVDRLIDSHLRWDVVGAKELIDSYPKDASIDPRHAAHFPVLRVALDEPINLIATFHDTPHQILAKVPRFVVEGEMIPE
jgi:hypothetical protein